MLLTTGILLWMWQSLSKKNHARCTSLELANPTKEVFPRIAKNKRGIPKKRYAKGVQAKFGLFQKQKAKGQVFPVVKKDRGASQETGT